MHIQCNYIILKALKQSHYLGIRKLPQLNYNYSIQNDKQQVITILMHAVTKTFQNNRG